MAYIDEFPDWKKIVEYFENSDPVMTRVRSDILGRPNFEELLNKETYALYKLLKQM